jgi:hypothetical protein
MEVKITNRLLTALFFLLITFTLSAQDEPASPDTKHKPSVMLGVSGLKYMGYIGSHTNVNPLLDARLGYFLAVEQRFGKVLGVELGAMYGKLAGTDNQTTTTTMYVGNIQSQVIQGQLMLTANFDGLMKKDPTVAPFIKAGIGYMMFNTSSDLKSSAGYPYIYLPDGSIVTSQTVTVGSVTTSSLVPTRRDYTYETKIKTNGQTGTLVVPAMLGLNFKFGKHMSTMIGAGYTFCLSNWIDGSGKGSAGYITANVGLRYEFKEKSAGGNSNSPYKDIDFKSIDHLDADADGVPDDQDMCHGTPHGVKVDAKGCPLDSDNDGVPDYMDKEPNTAKGNKVDGFGVTINDAELVQRQKDWETQAPERSKEFNVAPSAAYLKKVEEDAKKANKGKFNASKIPADLRSADVNQDGYISADEITKTIDGFFEGNSDFNVEKINKLIDFFFEQ